MEGLDNFGLLKILLIEDSSGDAVIISKILQQALPGMHSLTKASTLEEALTILSEQEFDVALLDRSLPDSSGINGLHSLQNLSPQLPVIFLTGYNDERTAFEAITQGAEDYLFKDQLQGQIIKRSIQYAILRKQFEGILMTRANYDLLTGIANRPVFENRLDMAIEKVKRLGGNVEIMLLDLDKFKQVNDTLGHAAGDKLLVEVAERLRKSVRAYDTVARFGGDEFAILFEEAPLSQDSKAIAQKIIHLIQTPFNISGHVFSIDISIGIAHFDSQTNIDRELLIKHADTAMYQAKSFSGSAFCVYGKT